MSIDNDIKEYIWILPDDSEMVIIAFGISESHIKGAILSRILMDKFVSVGDMCWLDAGYGVIRDVSN